MRTLAMPHERYGIPGKRYGEMDTAETVTALKAFWRDMPISWEERRLISWAAAQLEEFAALEAEGFCARPGDFPQLYWWHVTLQSGQRIDLRADIAIYEKGEAWFKRRGQEVAYFPNVAAVVRDTFA